MKRLFCILLTLLLLGSSLCILPAAAAQGSLSATVSASTVTVGQTVTITLKYSGGGAKIAAIDAQVTHNVDTFEFVSCTGAQANGKSGVVKISWFPEGDAPTSTTITLTFKAKAAGAGNFSVSTTEFYNDDDYSSLGTPGETLSVSANNPTLSGNAKLASLTPSKGTLTPKFDPNTTKYTIDVNYDVTSLTLSATAQDKGAKTVVSGKNSLSVGKNTREITVTAPNGTTKVYTVVINRAAQKTTGSTTVGTGTTGTTTTTAPPPEDVEVTVGGELMTVSESQPSADLPTGFQWNYVNIGGVDVSAAKSEDLQMTLVYLISKVDGKGGFYIYDAKQGSFAPFRSLAVSGGSFVLLDMPAGQTPPDGAVTGSFACPEGTVSAFVFEDAAMKDFTVVYAISPKGVTGLYVHDAADGSLQRYRVFSPAEGNPSQSTTPAQPTQAVQAKPSEKNSPVGDFAAFVTANTHAILVVAAAVCALALLIAVVVMSILLFTRRNKGNH